MPIRISLSKILFIKSTNLELDFPRNVIELVPPIYIYFFFGWGGGGGVVKVMPVLDYFFD